MVIAPRGSVSLKEKMVCFSFHLNLVLILVWEAVATPPNQVIESLDT